MASKEEIEKAIACLTEVARQAIEAKKPKAEPREYTTDSGLGMVKIELDMDDDLWVSAGFVNDNHPVHRTCLGIHRAKEFHANLGKLIEQMEGE